MSVAVKASCHCGANVIRLAALPAEVTDCNCSICRRYGVLWSYHRPADVDLSGAGSTQTYSWGPRTLAFHRCRECGCVTHWSPLAGRPPDRFGVNSRLLPLEVRTAIRIRRLDGAVTERYLDD